MLNSLNRKFMCDMLWFALVIQAIIMPQSIISVWSLTHTHGEAESLQGKYRNTCLCFRNEYKICTDMSFSPIKIFKLIFSFIVFDKKAKHNEVTFIFVENKFATLWRLFRGLVLTLTPRSISLHFRSLNLFCKKFVKIVKYLGHRCFMDKNFFPPPPLWNTSWKRHNVGWIGCVGCHFLSTVTIMKILSWLNILGRYFLWKCCWKFVFELRANDENNLSQIIAICI